MFNLFFSENRAVYKANVGKCRAGQATDDKITRCKRFACWITRSIGTHSEYVILLAFPQQWLHERASIPCCM
jgi:hypothetical protein